MSIFWQIFGTTHTFLNNVKKEFFFLNKNLHIWHPGKISHRSFITKKNWREKLFFGGEGGERGLWTRVEKRQFDRRIFLQQIESEKTPALFFFYKLKLNSLQKIIKFLLFFFGPKKTIRCKLKFSPCLEISPFCWYIEFLKKVLLQSSNTKSFRFSIAIVKSWRLSKAKKVSNVCLSSPPLF